MTTTLTDAVVADFAARIVKGNPDFAGTVWTTRKGERLEVATMSASHAENTVRMLARSIRRAAFYESLRLSVYANGPGGDVARDRFEAELDAVAEVDPEEVLAATPLGAALLAQTGR